MRCLTNSAHVPPRMSVKCRSSFFAGVGCHDGASLGESPQTSHAYPAPEIHYMAVLFDGLTISLAGAYVGRREAPDHLRRSKRPELGVSLIDLGG